MNFPKKVGNALLVILNFVPLPPLRNQPEVAMPTLLAPQEGTGKFLQVEG